MNFRSLWRGAAVLTIPILIAGCSSRSIMMDVDAPQELRNQSVVIPLEGIVITSSLHLKGDVEILGEGPIFLKGEGRIVVEKNSQVSLENITIEASEIKAAEGEVSVYLVAVKQGKNTSLLIDNSKFFIDIQYEKNELEAPWDQPPKFWAIGTPDGDSDPVSAMTVVIRNSHFINKQPYAAGALELLQAIKVDASPILKGEIEGSEFHGFHGVILANNLEDFSVSENLLMRNSFANIFIHGNGVTIENNRLYYPGNGTTGDGITAFDKLTNSVIDNNLIFAGSCYGVLIRGKEIRSVTIKNNSIVNGITSAIMVKGSDKNASDVRVVGNVVSGNHGFAVAFIGVADSIIEGNQFSDNAKGFPSQVYMELGTRVALKNNLAALALTPEWAKGLQLYRSHVKSDDSSFTLPRNQKSGGGNIK